MEIMLAFVDEIPLNMEIIDEEVIDMHVSQTQLPEDEVIPLKSSIAKPQDTSASQIQSDDANTRDIPNAEILEADTSPDIIDFHQQNDIAVTNMEIIDEEVIDMHISQTQLPEDEVIPLQSLIGKPQDTSASQIQSDDANTRDVKNLETLGGLVGINDHEEDGDFKPNDLVRCLTNIEATKVDYVENKSFAIGDYEEIDLHISQTQYDPDYDITQSADKALAMTGQIYKSILNEENDDSIFPSEIASAPTLPSMGPSFDDLSDNSHQSISVIRVPVPMSVPIRIAEQATSNDPNKANDEPMSVYDIPSTLSPPNPLLQQLPKILPEPAGENNCNNYLLTNLYEEDHKPDTPTQIDNYYKVSPLKASPSKKPAIITASLMDSGEKLSIINLEEETQPDNELDDWIDAKKPVIMAPPVTEASTWEGSKVAFVGATTDHHQFLSSSSTLGTWMSITKSTTSGTKDIVPNKIDEDVQRSMTVLETVVAQQPLAECIGSENQDVLRLKLEFNRKLEELLRMKADLEQLSRGSNMTTNLLITETTNKDGFGTLDCADILVNMLTTNSSSLCESRQEHDQNGHVTIDSGANMSSTSAPNTGSTRKFNTFWNMKQLPTPEAAVIEPGLEISSSHNKMRRRFASTSPCDPKPIQNKKDTTSKLFSLPGQENNDDWIDDSSNDSSPAIKQNSNKIALKKNNGSSSLKPNLNADSNLTDTSAAGAVSADMDLVTLNRTQVITSNSSGSSPTGSNVIKKTVKIMDHTEEAQPLVVDVPIDIPAVFVHEGIPRIWSEAWKELEEYGWYWTKGRGLIDFYYIRPYAKPGNPFKLGQDFFTATDDVVKFLKKFAIEKKQPLHSLPARSIASSNSSDAQISGKVGSKRAATQLLEDDDRMDRSGSSTKHTTPPVPHPSNTKNGVPTKSQTVHHRVATAGINAEPTASSSSQVGSRDDVHCPQDRHDIRSIPWKELWKILRAQGWKWDFGPGHLNYFYIPGFDYKQDKEAILGIHKFVSEDSIRRYIKKELRDGGQVASDKWKMFFVGTSSGSSDIHRADSQQESQQIDDPSWTLITHRKRRESAPTFPSDAHPEDSSDIADDSSMKRTKSLKRRKTMDSKRAMATGDLSVATSSASGNSNTVTADEMMMTQAQSCPSPSLLQPTTRLRPPSKVSREDVSTNSPLLCNSPMISGVQRQSSAIANSSASSNNRAKQSSDAFIFDGIKFIFSGIAEKQREKLESMVKKEKGKIITDIPSDVQHMDRIVLISQPKDFRKPKYLNALLNGIPIVHFEWILQSVHEKSLQPLALFALPSIYSALHSHFIFRTNSSSSASLPPSPSSFSLARGSRKHHNLLINLKVINLTGMKVWDDILLASGAIVLQPDQHIYRSLLAADGTNSSATVVDIILFDPVVYTRSYILNFGHKKYSAASGGHNCNSSKKNLPFLEEIEMKVLQRCSVDGLNTPIVGSIDWLVHCFALDKLINVNILDLFQLPTNPIRYPTAFKSDYELDPTLHDSTGERYSKYDLVFFTNSIPSPATPSAKITGISPESKLVGKIIGFTRRNEDSSLMVRIQKLDFRKITGSEACISSHFEIFPEVDSTSNAAIDTLISVKQLCGKVVALHSAAYKAVKSYTSSSSNDSGGSIRNTFYSLSSVDDVIFSTCPSFETLWPVIPWTKDMSMEVEENDDDEDGSASQKGKGRRLHIQASQDI